MLTDHELRHQVRIRRLRVWRVDSADWLTLAALAAWDAGGHLYRLTQLNHEPVVLRDNGDGTHSVFGEAL